MTIRSGVVKRHRESCIASFLLSSVQGETTLERPRIRVRRIRTHRSRHTKVWLVQSISIARLCATLLFAALVSTKFSVVLLSCLYVFAIVTDVIDGYVSRTLNVETYVGKIMDLVADKSLTVVSMIYAASRGIDLLPIALIASREIIMIGMRLVIVEGTQLFQTSRIFGGTMAVALWSNTVILIWSKTSSGLLPVANAIYWVCALVLGWNLFARIYSSGPRISAALRNHVPFEKKEKGSRNGCNCIFEEVNAGKEVP